MKRGIAWCAAVTVLLAAHACNRSPEKAIPATSMLNMSSAKLAVIPDDYEAGEIIFSSDGRRVAYGARKDDKYFVVLDNRPGKIYEGVADLVFGPDSRTFAYRAVNKEGKMRIVADGRESVWSENLGKPTFSPDGHILGYEAKRGDKYVIVAGDKESPLFDMSYSPPLFSADSSRIAYIEQHYDTRKNNIIISNADMTDRKRGKDYDLLSGITLSQDRSLLAYVAERNDRRSVVTVDFSGKGFEEKEGSPYDEVSGPALSPDGKRSAHIAKRSGKVFLVRDGVEQPYPADDIAIQPLFSQDGRRIVSVGVLGDKNAVVLDGKVGPGYDEIGRPAFSPDGAMLAYPARKDNLWFIVVNGKEGPADYDMIVTPQFSPDGSRVVYRGRKDGKRFVVTADTAGRTLREHPRHDMVWQPVFAADGKSVAYGVKDGRELWWKVEPLD